MKLNKPCDKVVCLEIRMSNNRTVSLFCNKVSKLCVDLPKRLVLFLLSNSHLIACFFTIAFVGRIEVLAPATAFETEDNVVCVKVSPRLFDRVKGNV